MLCSTYQLGASLVNSLPSSLSAVCELGHSSAAVTLYCVISQEVLSYGHAGVSPSGQQARALASILLLWGLPSPLGLPHDKP